MTTGAWRGPAVPPIPVDPALAGAEDLLRPAGIGVLDRFLAERQWRLQAARPVQALYQPGRSLVVRYRAEALNPAGVTRVLCLCAETRHKPAPILPPPGDLDPAVVPAEPVASVGPYLVWSYPYDPTLPALAEAGRGPAVRRALAALDRPAVGVSVEPIRYRPHRRATFRYTLLDKNGRASEVLYGKVLTPERASGLLEAAGVVQRRRPPRRRLRRRALTAPRLSFPLAHAYDGLLLFEPLAGQSLRDLLLRGASLPAPGRIPVLLDQVADLAASGTSEGTLRRPGGDARRDAERMLHHTHKVLSHITPDLAGRVDRLVDSLRERIVGDPGPAGLIHGDLYDAQVFVDSDYSLGLIDLDDLGPGDRATDAANFCGHLLALALAVPSASPLIRAYRRIARPALQNHLGLGAASLAWRESMVMLQLAPGPFRVLDPNWPAEVRHRVELAERLFADEL